MPRCWRAGTLGWPMARWLVNRGEQAPADLRDRVSRALIARRARARADRLHHRRARVLRPDVSRHAGRAHPAARNRARRRGSADVPDERAARSARRTAAARRRRRHRQRVHRDHARARAAAGARRRDRHLRGRAGRREGQRARRWAPPIASTFRHGALLAGWTEPVDLIVSNPPYVAVADRGVAAGRRRPLRAGDRAVRRRGRARRDPRADSGRGRGARARRLARHGNRAGTGRRRSSG